MANYDELKKVLFGNQKQGDAINMVVAKIVGDTVAENTPEGEWPQRVESKTEYSADDHVARAQAEKDKIYPLVPASIKSCFEGEIGEWQASLLFAAQYYG